MDRIRYNYRAKGSIDFSVFLAFFVLVHVSSNAIGQVKNTKYLTNESLTYEEAIGLLEKTVEYSPYVSMSKEGKTDVGRNLHTVVFNADGVFNPDSIDRTKKSILLINNAIHPGESCGVDATVLLFDYLAKHRKEFPNLIVVAIPVYNIGGMLNRSPYNRSGQAGPEECGFRGNYQHLDLNRDFIKTDALNTESFHRIYHKWKPHLFMDTHTTNGSDHQYPLTLIVSQRNKMNPVLADFTYTKLEGYLYRKMKEKGKEITPYVYLMQDAPQEGIKDFLETPRYSSGYVNLFNTVGLISEAHKYAKFKDRVEYTYELLRTLCVFASGNSNELIRIKKLADAHDLNQNQFALNWMLDTATAETLSFKGYELEMIESETTGLPRRSFNRNKKATFQIPFYRNYIATQGVTAPKFYVIPQCYRRILANIERQGIQIEYLQKDSVITGGMYYLNEVSSPNKPYEKHYLHSEVTASESFQKVQFYKGDVMVDLNQYGKRYLVETLEPTAADAFFRWNFFDNVMQQKEWFSDFAFDPIAKELLETNPDLKQEFEEKRNTDEAFAKNHMAQLYWVFERSYYYEPEHKRYPVMRVY